MGRVGCNCLNNTVPLKEVPNVSECHGEKVVRLFMPMTCSETQHRIGFAYCPEVSCEAYWEVDLDKD